MIVAASIVVVEHHRKLQSFAAVMPLHQSYISKVMASVLLLDHQFTEEN